ncbi:MAG: SUMF1/EgtB/PvdO family nonheme iron enzyme [Anaerolineae bacterium]|nr:SUMF1/EgtB/PvdO family nonheme iron enzyme [Anaerolineae bacterium]
MDSLNGIVAILAQDDKKTIGTGFVAASQRAEETFIFTCAHVLQKNGYAFTEGEAVPVRFQANGQELTAYLAKAYSKPDTAEDVAVLFLTDPLPEGVEKLPLVAAAACQHQVTQAYGYPQGTHGQRGKGEILGLIPDPTNPSPHQVVQLRSSEITNGYSGAPVWSFDWERVLGMVRSGPKPDRLGRQGEVTYATTSETLVALCPELQLASAPGSAAKPLNQHFHTLIRELSERYQVDNRFVQLTLLLDKGSEADGQRYIPDAQRPKYNSLITLLQETGERNLVLLGKPGSGKTTLLQRLQLDQSWYALENTNLPPEQTRLTFFVRLSGYRGEKPGDPPPAPYPWLTAEWRRRYPTLPDFATCFQAGRLILLLDGLNEIPHRDQEDYQERVAAWQLFLAHYAGYGNTALFSCRDLDYTAALGSKEVPVRRVQVEPLTPGQIETFLSRYLGKIGPPVWEKLRYDPQQLALFSSPFYLRLLVDEIHHLAAAGNSEEAEPAFLSRDLLAVGRLGRAALLTGLVRRALHREIVDQPHPLFKPGLLLTENDRRQVINRHWATPTALPGDGPLIPHLEQLAYQMQDGWKTPEANLVSLPEKTVCARLDHPQAEQMIRAGVQLNVLDKDPTKLEIAYFHQLIQEYFAGRVLARKPEPNRVQTPWHEADIQPSVAEQLPTLGKGDALLPLPTTGWEESSVLAAAMTANPEQFIRDLMAANLPLAARCATLPELTLPPALKKQLRDVLVERINHPQADLRARIRAAEALGELGDSRFSRHTGPYGEYLLPPLVTITGGMYRIGSELGRGCNWFRTVWAIARGQYQIFNQEMPAHDLPIAGFAMGMYPLTNAEYRLFMDAGGYEDEQWWLTDAAQAWRRGERGRESDTQNLRTAWEIAQQMSEAAIQQLQADPKVIEAMLQVKGLTRAGLEQMLDELTTPADPPRQPAFWDDSQFNHPSQPVVGICWFEAQAYCAWLSAQTGDRYTLPTEVEWEAAARGTQGRRYAYGDTFDPTLGNTFETHLRRTSPVGVFPGGRTPEGIYDLSGNVWEWTSTLWGDNWQQPTYPYPYNRDDGREDPQDGTSWRVVRGGSWNDAQVDARAAYRSRIHPVSRYGYLGGRVVRRSPSP